MGCAKIDKSYAAKREKKKAQGRPSLGLRGVSKAPNAY
jgi:hypothetical protein